MSKLGEYLKTEREKKSLSIHEIGLSLKISPKILKAIEEGNSKDLPAKTFLRGFVKSYVQYLKIDQKFALDLFQEEYGTTRPEAPQKSGHETTPTNKPEKMSSIQAEKIAKKNDDIAIANQGSQKHYTLLIAGILLVLIAFVAKLMDKYQKESNTSSQNELVESLSSSTTTLPSVVATTLSSDNADANNAPEKPATAASVSGAAIATPTTVTSTTLAPITTTTLKAAPTTSTSTSTTTTTTTTTKPLVTTTTTMTTSTTTTTLNKLAITEVIVEALNQVKVRFSLSGRQKWESIDLSADQVHTFRARGNIDLEISDGGAVNVIVNGRERGVPGTIGKPIKLVYPK